MRKGSDILAGIFAVILAFSGAVENLGDTVNSPRRLFGLGEVRLMAVSPDLRFIASGGQGGAYLWDVETSALKQSLESAWSVTALVFSVDSKTLFVAGSAKIAAWDLQTGARVREFVGHGKEINRLQVSLDGQQLISASADNTVRVWSIASGAELRLIRTPGSPILDVALSPDGQTIATVDTFLTNCVKIWDLATQTQVGALPKTNWTAERCLFMPNGQLITTAPDKSVLLWDSSTGKQIRSFNGVTGGTTIIRDIWTPNENTIAAACNDGSVYLWNANSSEPAKIVGGDFVIAAAGVPGDFLVITAQLDYNIRIRQLPGGDTLRTFKGHTTSVHSGVAVSPDGRYVLSGGTESAVRLWDRRTGVPIREFVGGAAGTMAAAFSPDGSKVLTTVGLPEPAARVWKTETGELERELKWTGSWPMSAVFSWDGTKVAVRLQGNGVRIFDVASGAVVKTIDHSAWAAAIAFSPNAPLLALASVEGTADLYNYETGQLLHTFSKDAGSVMSVQFSPRGETLLVAWMGGVIHLYNALTLELRREFFTPPAFLEAAVFSPDGRYILTGEGWPLFTATLWETATAEPLRTFAGHKWNVSALGFSPDGTSIVTGAELVRKWTIADLASRLTIRREENQVHLTWALGELQQGVSLEGPWETVPNAISPFSPPPGEPARFYRIRVETPN